MAGPGQATSAPLQVDVSSLAPRADANIVTPAAVEALTGAFHKGFITTDDIMERLSQRTKEKQKLELATTKNQLADANNPDIQAARTNIQLAQGAEAKNQLDNAGLAKQAKEWQLKATILDAQSAGGHDKMREALVLAGFPVTIDTNVGLTDANKTEIEKRFAGLIEFKRKQAEALGRAKGIESRFTQTEQPVAGGTAKGEMQRLFQNGVEITTDDLKDRTQKAAEFERTPFSSWYLTQTAQPVAAPAAAPVSVAAPAAPASAVQPVSPTAPAASAVVQPARPQIGQSAPGLGMVTGFVPDKSSEIVRPTEGQQRALLAVPRFQEANAALADLQAKNYDPTTWRAWVDSYLPQIAKSGNRKEYETAMSAWAQGLLRLESGAAITPKEETWYVQTFFPIVGDKPINVAQKASLRAGVESMATEIATAGNLPEDLKKAKTEDISMRMRALRNTLPGGAVAAPVATTPATPSAAPVFSSAAELATQPAGTVFKDAAGNWRRKL